MAEFALFALLMVASFVGMVVLWRLIEHETDDRPTMDRADAERAARQDTGRNEDTDSVENTGRGGRREGRDGDDQ